MHLVLAGVLFYFFSWSVILSNGSQMMFINLFELVSGSYYKNTKLKKSYYLPIFFFLFLVVLVNNLLGLMPYAYAVTSSLIFNFYVVLTMFGMINLMGIIYHKWNFFNIFMPKGLPLTFTWFLMFFETISYVASVFSLTIRLFANMLSGHILQHILMTFSFKIFLMPGLGMYLFIFPWIITFLVTGLEIAICFLQAYVLLTLLLIYFSNVINLH